MRSWTYRHEHLILFTVDTVSPRQTIVAHILVIERYILSRYFFSNRWEANMFIRK